MAPGVAMAELWALYSADPLPDGLCGGGVRAPLACLEGEVWTWSELDVFDSPLLLEIDYSRPFFLQKYCYSVRLRQWPGCWSRIESYLCRWQSSRHTGPGATVFLMAPACRV